MQRSKLAKKAHVSTSGTGTSHSSGANHGSTAHLQAEAQLTREVTSLTEEVQKLKDMELIQIFKHPLKFLWFSFLKGVMVGFGSVLGASLVVGIFLYLLAQISLVPVIGDFVQKVIDQIQPGTAEDQQDSRITTPAPQPPVPQQSTTPTLNPSQP